MSAHTSRRPRREQLNRLLRPRSIAIVGASAGPSGLGGCVLANLERAGYGGALYLVNPKHSRIGERPCLHSVDDLPEGVDCAVLAIPRTGVLDALESCARRNVGGAIVFSAGFAESGEQGRAEQERITRLASESGMVVEGPNCLGMVNHLDRAPLTFVVTETDPSPRADRIALVSQSGAIAAVLGTTLAGRGIGLSFSISTGNEAATGVEDFLEYLIEDADARVIALVVEQFRYPRRLLELAPAARKAGKAILLLHPGKSSAARAAAATHTGAMAGDYEVMRAKVSHAGVLIAQSLEEFVDIADILVRCPTPPCGGTAVLTESGLFKALTLDLCERLELSLPPLSAETAAALRQTLPDFIAPSNPLDITAQGLVDPDLYRRTLPPVLDDPRFGSVSLAIIMTDASTSALKLPPIIRAIEEIRPAKPVLLASMDEGASISGQFVNRLRRLGVPFFPSAERAFRALAAVTTYAARLNENAPASIEPCATVALDRGVTPEYKSKAILAKAGIAVPLGALACTVSEAQIIASRIGYPVALKAQASALSHKSDAGGVALAIADPEALDAAWRNMYETLASTAPGLKLNGILVEKMSKRGVELIVGARNDPEWGPVLLVGFGGILAEAFQDTRLVAPEISREGIARELLLMKSGALLRGLRGSPRMDVEAVADIVARLGGLMLSNPLIREVDINPVMVYPAGEGAVALDALIVTD